MVARHETSALLRVHAGCLTPQNPDGAMFGTAKTCFAGGAFCSCAATCTACGSMLAWGISASSRATGVGGEGRGDGTGSPRGIAPYPELCALLPVLWPRFMEAVALAVRRSFCGVERPQKPERPPASCAKALALDTSSLVWDGIPMRPSSPLEGCRKWTGDGFTTQGGLHGDDDVNDDTLYVNL